MSNLIPDVRYALRMLAKNPGFTVVAVATLTIGIGANTAIFSAVDALLLHPLAFPHADRLVSITKDMPMFELAKSNSSPLDFLDYRSHTGSFSGMGAVDVTNFNLTGNREPERVGGMRVSANLFPMLGVAPILGRAFTAEEEQVGKDHVAILSEELWKGRFGGDARILGSQIQIEGENYTVVGVTRPILQFVSGSQLWMPLSFTPTQLAEDARGFQFLRVIARMKPGATLASANADLNMAASRMTKERTDWYPKGWSINAEPLARSVAAPLRDSLFILIAAVALVLLIGCANVANLLLARASSREREIGIRTALGASRARLVAQLLTEGCIVSILAGCLGILTAVWALDLFERFGPPRLLRGQHLEIDWFICGFAVAASLLTTLIFALAPAIAASSADVNHALTERSRTGSAPKSRLRDALVTAEVALSLVLLICAGLLVRSFQALEQAETGFSRDHELTFTVSLPVAEYAKPESVIGFYERLLARIGSLPGVSSAGGVNNLPLDGNNSGGSFEIVGRKWPASEPQPDVSERRVTPGYFATLRIPTLRGRAFTEQDGFAAPKVALVDEPFVRRFFPNENPIGRKISRGGEFTVVGVVGAIKKASLSETPTPTMYFPAFQKPTLSRALNLVVRTAGMDPLALVAPVRREVAALDRNLPVYRVSTMNDVLESSLARGRFSTTLTSAFALIAMLLAAIGIYGVVSYTVSRRSQEIGIRMALGAQAGDALRLILKQGMIPVFIGIAFGFVASLAATRAMANLLYGVSPADPFTFICLSGALALVAALAGYIPARRATRVDPIRALRWE